MLNLTRTLCKVWVQLSCAGSQYWCTSTNWWFISFTKKKTVATIAANLASVCSYQCMWPVTSRRVDFCLREAVLCRFKSKHCFNLNCAHMQHKIYHIIVQHSSMLRIEVMKWWEQIRYHTVNHAEISASDKLQKSLSTGISRDALSVFVCVRLIHDFLFQQYDQTCLAQQVTLRSVLCGGSYVKEKAKGEHRG